LESSDAVSEETCLPFGTLLEGESASFAGPVARAYHVCSRDSETSEKVETASQQEIPGGTSLQDTPATLDRERILRKDWKEEENWERAKARAAFEQEEVVRVLPEGSGKSTGKHFPPHADEARRPEEAPVCDSSEFSGDPEERNAVPGQNERPEKKAPVSVSSAQRRRRGRWFYLSFLILAVGGGILSVTPWRTVLLDHLFVSLSQGTQASETASPAAGRAPDMPVKERERLPLINQSGDGNRQEGGVGSSPGETPAEKTVIPSKVSTPPPPLEQGIGAIRNETIRTVSDSAQPDKSPSLPPGKEQSVQ
jgi:hypothetical protein